MRHYAHREHLAALETNVASKYLCLSALAALIDAVEDSEKTSFVKGTLSIKFLPAVGVMLLDPSTVTNLEILRNLRTGDAKASLFGALNSCITAAGTRFLRSSLIQPVQLSSGQEHSPCAHAVTRPPAALCFELLAFTVYRSGHHLRSL